jgi:hypothetical protein
MTRTYWATTHHLVNGRWITESGYASAIVATQRKRGNPDLAPWCEGSYK